jgi:hypothetical protein
MPGVSNFAPSTSGLHFRNEFPPMPLFPQNVWPFRYGAGAGCCGGMAFGTRDYFETGTPVPDDRLTPTADAQIFQYVASRLIDSLVGTIGFQYYEWQTQSNAVCAQRTLRDQWPMMKSELDAGRMVCLGLIEVHTSDFLQLGSNHQVLAYWYDTSDDGVTTTISLYDPNHEDDDTTRLVLTHLDPSTLEGDSVPSDFLRLIADDQNNSDNKFIRGTFTVPYQFDVPWFEVIRRPEYLANIILTTETATGAPSIASLENLALLVCWTGTDNARHLNLARVGPDGGILDKVVFDGANGRPTIESAHPPSLVYQSGRGYVAWTASDRRVNLTTFEATAHHADDGSVDHVSFSGFDTHRLSATSAATGPALAVRTIPRDDIVYLAWPVEAAAHRIVVGVCSGSSGYSELRQLELTESTSTEPTLDFSEQNALVLTWIGRDDNQSVNITMMDSDPRFPEQATGNKVTFPFGAQGRPGFASDGSWIRMAWVNHHDGGGGEIGPPGGVGGGHVSHPLMSVYEPSTSIPSLGLTVRGHGRTMSPVMQNRQMEVQDGASLAFHAGYAWAAFTTTSVLDDVGQGLPDAADASGTSFRDHRIRIGCYTYARSK